MGTIETLANKLGQARLSGDTVPQNALEGSRHYVPSN